MSASSSRPKAKVNLRSTAVKRIMQEASELAESNEEDFTAGPLESDIFEWHCTMRGVPDSEYDGGLYHLRIILPPSYPMSAPDIMLLTPNGRFELGKKICIDGLTSFHAGSWQPAWGVRTAILGLRSFWMQGGEALSAIGALDYTKEERRRLAKLSREWVCPTCSCRNIDCLPDIPRNKGEDRGSTADDVEQEEKRADETTDMDEMAKTRTRSRGRSSGSVNPSDNVQGNKEDKPDHTTIPQTDPTDSQPTSSFLHPSSRSTPLTDPHIPNSGPDPDHTVLSAGPSDTLSSPLQAGTSEEAGATVPPPRPSPTPTTQYPARSSGLNRLVPLWLDAAIFACLSILFFLLVRKAIVGSGRDEGMMRELEL